MLIDWTLDSNITADTADMLSLLQLAADRSTDVEGIPFPCAISVRLCDDDSIEALNQSHRGIARSTDVLSFPTVTYRSGKTARESLPLLQREYDDASNAVFLGDIIISVPHVIAQAQEYGHSVDREAAYLLVHGICHLMGYDHIEEEERKVMRETEEKILSSVGISRDASNPSPVSDETLIQLAREAMQRSYSPYSHFPVGAALLSVDGRIFQGCNVENASFGATNCAERTAVFKAVSEGALHFDTIAIAANTIAWPCGICRQVLNEFAPDLRVIAVDQKGTVLEKNLRELLPGSFGPSDVLG